MKEADIKVIFDNGGGKWLYYNGEDGSYIHDYAYNDIEQLVSDAMKLATGESPIKEGWDGNEIGDYYPVLEGEEDAKNIPLFAREHEGCGWWIVAEITTECTDSVAKQVNTGKKYE